MTAPTLSGAPLLPPGSFIENPSFSGYGFVPPDGTPEMYIELVSHNCTAVDEYLGGGGFTTTVMYRIEGDSLLAVEFEQYRMGGCGAFSAVIGGNFEDAETAVNNEWEIVVYIKLPSESAFTVWYRGFTRSIYRTRVDESKWNTTLTGIGYVAQLDRIDVSALWTNHTTSGIVRNILDSYTAQSVDPSTDVTYNASDVAGAYSVVRFNYSGSAMRAIKAMAEIQQSTEWGVDEHRRLFFKAKDTSTVAKHLFEQKDLVRIMQAGSQPKRSNKVVMEGETTYKTTARTYSDSVTMTDFRRSKFTHVTPFSDSGDLDRWAAGFLLESNTNQEWLSVDVTEITEKLHSTATTALHTAGGIYRLHFQDGTTKDYQHGKVVYRLGNVNRKTADKSRSAINLAATVYLGQFGKDLVEEVEEIDAAVHMLRMKLRLMQAAPYTAKYIVTAGFATPADLPNQVTFGNSVCMRGTLAARPASAITGALYSTSDEAPNALYRYSGDPTASWEKIATV